MAGEIYIFNEFKHNLGLSEMNMETDTFNLMLSQDSATDPTIDDADPGYLNATRSPDWTQAAFESDPGGNYSAGGTSLGAVTWTLSLANDNVLWDAGDLTTAWAANASNPTSARYGCCFNFTDADKKGVFYIDLGQDFNMVNGDLTITWSTSPDAIFTLA